jgi:pyridoxal phosphate enzyme (YggS family)
METHTDTSSRLHQVMELLSNAALRAGRDPQSVQLVTVTKTQPVDRIVEAVSAGAEIIGENYIQEARGKFDALVHHPVQWHYIGHLQSNKAKYAVRLFDLIHSVDSLKLAAELNKQAAKTGKVQDILIQVNISRETTKSGLDEAGAMTLANQLSQHPHIRLMGLMTMPPYFNAPEKVRPFFAQLRQLRDQMADALHCTLPHLSMGMTGDFEVAIEEGATLIRVGTAIFGERR